AHARVNGWSWPFPARIRGAGSQRCSWRLRGRVSDTDGGRPFPFPAPYRTIVGIDDGAGAAEPALLEDARGSVWHGERMCPNEPHPHTGEGKGDERRRGLRGVALALEARPDAVAHFHAALP